MIFLIKDVILALFLKKERERKGKGTEQNGTQWQGIKGKGSNATCLEIKL